MSDSQRLTPDLNLPLAAIDLGSNSFHMIVVQVSDGNLQVIDKLKEMVRLGEGLQDDKSLDGVVAERALTCLDRFNQRLRSLPPANVRAVGTNTMRQIQVADQFLPRSQQALGHDIEVIAGREEARLIYLGVAHGLAAGEEKRLVVDIGGGSTELIVGQGFEPLQRESLHMGCVSMTRRFFPDGEISVEGMRKAVLTCEVQLHPVLELFRESGWSTAVGSSGTINAINDIVIANGWSEANITRASLELLADKLTETRRIKELSLKGLDEERKPVFPGGVAVLLAVFRQLDIKEMQVSSEALREGLIYDMIGRTRHEDPRDRTIQALSQRYNVDEAQAQRVDRTAQALFNQVVRAWGMLDSAYPSMLSWASYAHEIGLAVSHAQFHKHGAYLVENSDLSGFSKQEQQVLAALVRGHRQKFPTSVFDALPKALSLCAKQLCILLRLAVLLHRSRSTLALPIVLLDADETCLKLQFPAGWLENHPLTLTELEQEATYLQATGYALSYA